MKARRAPRVWRRSSPASECVRCQSLRRENEALRQEIASLRESLVEAHRAGKRQAAPFSKGPPKMAPQRPGRKPGKDYGVKARRVIPESIDEIHTVPPPACCPYCGGDVVETSHTAAQYQEDIPPVKPLIRRFDVHFGRCVRCKRPVRGRHPLQTSDALGAAGVHIGPRALALAADLNKRIGAPFGKVSAVFCTAFSLSITRGGISQALDRVAAALAPTYDTLVQQIQSASVVAADETGWKVGGRLWWLWAFVTPRVTVYRIMDGRGYDEASLVLGADFDGKLLRDGWAPYRRFEHATHQTCLAHLVRRCAENLETAKQGAARLPHAVLDILRRALRLRDHWLDHPPTPHGRATHAGRVAAAMNHFLAWRPTDDENRKLVKHLRKERDALFLFLKNPIVPATNWWGEQAIRPAVVTRKVWGGNRTPRGALTQQTIASVLRTCHQQRVDPCLLVEELLRSPVARIASLPSLASGP